MKYQGSPVSRGIAISHVFCFHDEPLRIDERTLEEPLRDLELHRYHSAIATARQNIEETYEKCCTRDKEKAMIFQAHVDILDDIQVREEIEDAILRDGRCASWAVATVYDRYAQVLASSDDEIVQERATDLKDVSARIQKILSGRDSVSSLEDIPDDAIILAYDLMPSQTVSLNPQHVKGIITEVGGMTSHTAILARSLGIPAVLGIPDLLKQVKNDTLVILDGIDGILITNPSEEQLAFYESKQTAFLKEKDYEETFMPRKPVTKDGLQIGVHLNIGDADSSRYKKFLPYVDGVGLFRSEFLYLGRTELPSEEEQYEIYSQVLRDFGDKPVILRTLDIGGDKKTDCIPVPAEGNPFLGLRALRLCFAMPSLFRTQLRAAFRASINGNLWLMFPMVNSIEDVRKAREFCREICAELEADGISYSKDIKIGVMIETPSMALMAAEAAEEVDFASIGTNDLCQYTLAVDRLNPTVRQYYQPYHPALLKLIAYVAECFSKVNKPISICGELGGDSRFIPVLLGLGIHKFSMNSSAVAAAKAVICNTDYSKARQLAKQAVTKATEEEVRALLAGSSK